MFGRLTGAMGFRWPASTAEKTTQTGQQHTVREEQLGDESEYGFVSRHGEKDEDIYVFIDDTKSSTSKSSNESDFEDVELPADEQGYDAVSHLFEETHEGSSVETDLALIHASKLDDQGKKETVSLVISLISSCLKTSAQIKIIKPKTLNLLASILKRDLKIEQTLEECKQIIQSMIKFMRSEEGEIKEDKIRNYLDLNIDWNREQISHILKWCKVVQKLNKDGDLRGEDLSGLNLKGLDFSNVKMNGANLTQTGLTPADFADRKKVRQANFSYPK